MKFQVQHCMATMQRAFLVSVLALLVCSSRASAGAGGASRWHSRQLQQAAPAAAPPSTTNTTANGTSPAPGNLTAAGNTTVAGSETLLPPSAAPPASPPSEKQKESISEKWKNLESGKSPAEKGIAITVGVLMLLSILTCLVCCVFRRGGQWRVPGLQWFKKKFGPKDKYQRYVDSQDDGF